MSDVSDLQKRVEVLDRALKREKAARKEAEQLLEDKSRDLYLSNQILEGSLNNLKEAQSQLVQSEKMASVGQLAAGIAHEINNPVGFISSNLTTLREYVDDLKSIIETQNTLIDQCEPDSTLLKPLRQLEQSIDIEFILSDVDLLVRESVDGAKRVKKIVSDLSEFSHINSPDMVQENINDLLDKTLNLAHNQLKYDIEVKRDYSDLPLVDCNGGKMGQVFLNLIINAAHAMEKNDIKQLLTITTRNSTSKEGEVEILIADNGSGIAEEKMTKIFDPFFTTKEIGKGTGLGLHIVQDIIKSHGGSISVESQLNKGTVFSIKLPVVPSGDAGLTG